MPAIRQWSIPTTVVETAPAPVRSYRKPNDRHFGLVLLTSTVFFVVNDTLAVHIALGTGQVPPHLTGYGIRQGRGG